MITQNSIHVCWLCGEEADLRVCKIDELGSAVHEACYMLFALNKSQAQETTQPLAKRLPYRCRDRETEQYSGRMLDRLIHLVSPRLVLNQGSHLALQYIDLTAPPPRASAYSRLKIKIKGLLGK